MHKALSWARAHGLSPVPLEPCVIGKDRSGKRPTDNGWLDKDYKDADFPVDCNVGIHTGRPLPGGGWLLVVDVDQKPGKEGEQQWTDLCSDEGIDLQTTLVVESGSGAGGYHLYFRTTEPFRDTKLPNCPDVDFKGLGGQVVAAHCAHFTGGTYTPIEASIAWAPIELEAVLKAQTTHSRGQRLTDEDVFSQPEIVLGPEFLGAWIKEHPRHHMVEIFSKMLRGEAFSAPGQRHQDIRLGMMPQILGTLGPNVQFDSLAWAFRGDYPDGLNGQDRRQMYDALRTAARKVDLSESQDISGAANFVALSKARSEEKAAEVRSEICEVLDEGQAPDPADSQQALLLAGALGLEVSKNRIKNDHPNVVKILDTFFSKRLRLNVRTGAPEVSNLPWEESTGWRTIREGADTNAFVTYFHNSWGMSVSSTILDTVLKVASSNEYDPVVEYLQGLEWDGQPRVSDFLIRALGCADTDHARAVTRCFLVGAVARALQPGCKLDTQLILSGPQGARKSTFFRSLCADPRWFSDTGRTQGEAEKDFLARLHTLWIWEDSELQASTRDEAAKKAFLSKTEDTFRPPFARLNVRSDRRFVCAGSTNEDEVLYDSTGSRRYHVLTVGGRVDIDYTLSVRDQIWAEAVHMYHAGVQWWLSDEEQLTANKVNAMYRAESPAEAAANKIQAWFEMRRMLQSVDASGEMAGTVPVFPGQFATDGTLWGASYLQIAEACRLTPTLVSKAVSVLVHRDGWQKLDQVRVTENHRLRTSVCVPEYWSLQRARREDLDRKNTKKQN